MRFVKAAIALVLLGPASVSGEEHKYMAFGAFSYITQDSGSTGMYLLYDDTTKRPPIRLSEKHPGSVFGSLGVYSDGPQVEYVFLTGGRWSGKAHQLLAASAHAGVGFSTVGGSPQLRFAEQSSEPAREGGALIGAGLALDWLFGRLYSEPGSHPSEDGLRLQVDILQQLTGTKGTRFRFALGWVIRYN